MARGAYFCNALRHRKSIRLLSNDDRLEDMVAAALTLEREIEEAIRDRVGRRIHDLTVELRPGRVVLRGQACSYHVKQLAQHGISNFLPANVRLENAIAVARRA